MLPSVLLFPFSPLSFQLTSLPFHYTTSTPSLINIRALRHSLTPLQRPLQRSHLILHSSQAIRSQQQPRPTTVLATQTLSSDRLQDSRSRFIRISGLLATVGLHLLHCHVGRCVLVRGREVG